MNRLILGLCLVLTLTTPNTVWALAGADCNVANKVVVDEPMDHTSMDHSRHTNDADVQQGTGSPFDCSCCADGCVAHCLGGVVFVRFELNRADGSVPGAMTEARYRASYFPSPPVSALYRPPIVS